MALRRFIYPSCALRASELTFVPLQATCKKVDRLVCQFGLGLYNAISNGGNTTNTWRTLTGGSDGEWEYIFETRNTISGIRYAMAKVNGVSGVILLPDDWSESFYPLYNTKMANANYSSNNISVSQWSMLEQYGAVFLPAAGYRDGTSFNEGNDKGYY